MRINLIVVIIKEERGKINEKNIECRQGLIRDSEGKLTLVIWVPYE